MIIISFRTAEVDSNAVKRNDSAIFYCFISNENKKLILTLCC